MPGGACRAPGLSRGSPEGVHQPSPGDLWVRCISTIGYGCSGVITPSREPAGIPPGEIALPENLLAAEDDDVREHRLPPLEGCPPAPAVEVPRMDRGDLPRIKGEIGPMPAREPRYRDPEDPAGVPGGFFDEGGGGHLPGQHPRDHEGDHGLHAGHARRGPGEFPRLLLPRVRGMVGGEYRDPVPGGKKP